jgi:hypothetical protein
LVRYSPIWTCRDGGVTATPRQRGRHSSDLSSLTLAVRDTRIVTRQGAAVSREKRGFRHGASLPLRTRSIRAARPPSPDAMHRHSVGALTSRAAFPVTALRFRNRACLQHSRARSGSRSQGTSNRSATRPDPLHPVHRHDVGRTRAPGRTAVDDRRYRNEARAAARKSGQATTAMDDEQKWRRSPSDRFLGAIGTAGTAICRRFRCRLDNDRMDLTGQLSNLSSDLRELLSKG